MPITQLRGVPSPDMSTPQVLARWVSPNDQPTTCTECGSKVEAGEDCSTCGQWPDVGMLAVVMMTSGGIRRIVVSKRAPSGGWCPVRNVPADPEAERMLRGLHGTTPGAVATAAQLFGGAA